MLFIFHYIFLRLAKQSQFIPLQNVMYFITLPFLVHKIFKFYMNDVLLFQCPVPGPKGYTKFCIHFFGSIHLNPSCVTVILMTLYQEYGMGRKYSLLPLTSGHSILITFSCRSQTVQGVAAIHSSMLISSSC